MRKKQSQIKLMLETAATASAYTWEMKPIFLRKGTMCICEFPLSSDKPMAMMDSFKRVLFSAGFKFIGQGIN